MEPPKKTQAEDNYSSGYIPTVIPPEQQQINTMLESLFNALPVDQTTFDMSFNYLSDKFQVVLTGDYPTAETNFRNWMNQNGYSNLPLIYFEFQNWPVLYTPSNNYIASQGPTLVWSFCKDAVRYKVNIYGGVINWTSSALSTNSYTVSGISFVPGTRYSWKVRCCFDEQCNSQTSWSTARNFWWQFQPPACPPSLASPANNAVISSSSVSLSSPALSWNICSNAVRYQLNVVGGGISWTSLGLTSTTYTMNGFTFTPGVSYTWKVRGCYDTSCTNVSSWSSTRVFWWQNHPTPTPTPTPAPCPPSLASPANNAVISSSSVSLSSPALSWNKCSAIRYQLRIVGGIAPGTINWTSLGLTGLSYTLNFSFDPGASYAWKVRGCYDTSCTNVSSWSTQRIFWWQYRPTPTPRPTPVLY